MSTKPLTMTERLAAVRALIALGATPAAACKRFGMNLATLERHNGYRLARLKADHYLTTADGKDVACYRTLGEAVYHAGHFYGISSVRHVDGTVCWVPGMTAEHAAELAPVVRLEITSEHDISEQ